MCLARNLMLFATLASAAAAWVAPSASAQPSEPEFHNQVPRIATAREAHAAADLACPAVVPTPPPAAPAQSPTATSGGCRLHLSGPSFVYATHLSAGGTEVVMMTCNLEFDLRLDAAGEGWISHQELTQGGVGSCTRKLCGQVTPPTSEGRAWQLYIEETELAGQGTRETAVILLCTEPLDGAGGTAHCEITVPVGQPTQHRYRLTANDVPAHGSVFPHCEISGTLDVEAVLGATGEAQLEENVEIRHT